MRLGTGRNLKVSAAKLGVVGKEKGGKKKRSGKKKKKVRSGWKSFVNPEEREKNWKKCFGRTTIETRFRGNKRGSNGRAIAKGFLLTQHESLVTNPTRIIALTEPSPAVIKQR